VVNIDTEMTSGSQVVNRLRGTAGGGIPWMAMLNADGEKVATSDGPQGNNGFPALPEEIEHFIAMLRIARPQMSAEHVEAIRGALSRP
jgi:hypothetical protein